MKKQQVSKKKENPYKYTKLAKWRTVYERLRTFIRCVDFIVMELLKRLVTTSVSDFVQQVETSINLNEMPKSRTVNWKEEKEKANRNTTSIFEEEVKIVAPVFNIRLVLGHQRKSASRRPQSSILQQSKRFCYFCFSF